MASLSIPNSLKAPPGPQPAIEAEEELLTISQTEMQARLATAADDAYESGVLRGRELQRKDEASAFSDLGDSLETQRNQAAIFVRKLEAAIADVGDELKRIGDQTVDVLDVACCAVATQFLIDAESSRDIVTALVEKLAKEYSPHAVIVRADPDVVAELNTSFADSECIDVVAVRDGAALSIELVTDGGNFEYHLKHAYEQLQDEISSRIGNRP